MLNYIRAEIFRINKRKYLYFYILIVAIMLIPWLFLCLSRDVFMSKYVVEIAWTMMFLPYISFINVVVIANIAMMDNYSSKSLRNSISAGMKKSETIIASIIVSMLYGIFIYFFMLFILIIPPIIIKGGMTRLYLFMIKNIFVMSIELFYIYLSYLCIMNLILQIVRNRGICIITSLILYYFSLMYFYKFDKLSIPHIEIETAIKYCSHIMSAYSGDIKNPSTIAHGMSLQQFLYIGAVIFISTLLSIFIANRREI